MISFLTQSDLFSAGTENNDIINKDGSLHCEFKTHEFPIRSRRAVRSVSLPLIIIKMHSGCWIVVFCTVLLKSAKLHRYRAERYKLFVNFAAYPISRFTKVLSYLGTADLLHSCYWPMAVRVAETCSPCLTSYLLLELGGLK